MKTDTIEDVDAALQGISNGILHGTKVNKEEAFKKADLYLDIRLQLMAIHSKTKVVKSGRA